MADPRRRRGVRAETPAIEPLGEAACVVEWPEPATDATAALARLVADALASAAPTGFREAIPTFRSCAVHFDPLVTHHAAVARAIRAALEAVRPAEGRRGTHGTRTHPRWAPRRVPRVRRAPGVRVVTVPVAYGGEYGPDLEAVARWAGLDPADVVRLHTESTYICVMLGFICGFPYLNGVPAAIAAPRLATPRTRVPAGSVGVAGPQTGVYPVDSPGGWRLLGRTPAAIWNPMTNPPALFLPGDRVRFCAIEPDAFATAKVRIEEEPAGGE